MPLEKTAARVRISALSIEVEPNKWVLYMVDPADRSLYRKASHNQPGPVMYRVSQEFILEPITPC